MKGASKLVVVIVGSVCCCLSLVPPSLAQKPSASARAKSAIQSWETSTQVEVPSDLQVAIVKKAASVAASAPTTEPSESAIKSATFVYLNNAAKKQQAKGGGTLDSSKVEAATLESAFSFISSSNGFGYLRLDSVPPGADIFVDNQFKAPTPENIGLSAGHHRYKVIAAGSKVLCDEDILIERDRNYQKTCPPTN
jgi:hypothetical protein